MNLLILSGKKQRSHSDKLKPSSHDLSLFQVSIDQINGEKECLCLQFKAQVHLDDPINKNATHLLINVDLHAHIALRGARHVLLREHILKDGRTIYLSVLFQSCITSVYRLRVCLPNLPQCMHPKSVQAMPHRLLPLISRLVNELFIAVAATEVLVLMLLLDGIVVYLVDVSLVHLLRHMVIISHLLLGLCLEGTVAAGAVAEQSTTNL